MPAAVEQVREQCRQTLREEAELLAMRDLLAQRHVSPAHCVEAVDAAAASGDQSPIERLKASLPEAAVAGREFERLLLLHAALRHLADVRRLPVSGEVRKRLVETYAFFADAGDKRWSESFVAGTSSFLSLCKLATLRRFPAGELEWEVSGLPRSWLFKVPKAGLPRLAWCVATRLRGFAPVVFPHLGVLRPKRIMLLEREFTRSYLRIARSIRLQPHIKGLVTSSWFYSPDIAAVSPHLEWLPRFFEENGGLVLPMGPAGAEAGGALAQSRKRRVLHEGGQYEPQLGLVIWPRSAVLDWAQRQSDGGVSAE